MKYLFDMGEVWHVYSDVGKQWIYQRLEQTGEEILDKNSENLPGPLGRLDILKELESECKGLKMQLEEKEKTRIHMEHQWEEAKEKMEEKYARAKMENRKVHEQMDSLLHQIEQLKEKNIQEKSHALALQKASFEQSYAELQNMAEELQKEGKLWRQRYLDLSYQISQNSGR